MCNANETLGAVETKTRVAYRVDVSGGGWAWSVNFTDLGAARQHFTEIGAAVRAALVLVTVPAGGECVLAKKGGA